MNEAEYNLDWYELSQSIAVGDSKEFYFFKEIEPLTFYCGILHLDRAVKNRCKIEEITHSELGRIKSINTEGLDYHITLEAGDEFTINAEEEPGTVYGFHHPPQSWIFKVKLSNIESNT